MTMTSMATTTASIITGIWSTMPTEVMMESRENTASSTRIWMMTCQKPERVGAEEYSAMPPSRRSCSSMVPLSSKKMPPPMRMKSRHEKALPKIVTRGSVRLTIQAMAESSTRRMTSARPRPVRKARRRCSCVCRREVRMEMKTRLSMPSTTSSTIRVPSPAQAEGSAIHEKSHMGAFRLLAAVMLK